jgi:hypothetical protein
MWRIANYEFRFSNDEPGCKLAMMGLRLGGVVDGLRSRSEGFLWGLYLGLRSRFSPGFNMARFQRLGVRASATR